MICLKFLKDNPNISTTLDRARVAEEIYEK